MADYNITAVTRRVVYTGSAGVGPYSFSFPVLTQSDLAVYKNATKLTLTTDYTVTISSSTGTGSITLVSAATGSDRITIIGSRTIERTTDFVTAGDLKASSLNEQLDSQIIMIQQLAEENKRTLKAPQYDPAAVEDGGTVNMVLPVAASRAGKTLAFDSSGNPVVGEDIGNWRGNWAAGTAYTVRDLVKDGSNANVYRANTAHTSTGTTPISSNADSAKWDLVVDAASAAASAAAAASSATSSAASAALANDWATKTSGPVAGGEYSAKYHANAAATSASNASTSASNASTSASNASAAQTAAEAARDATLAAYDSFDDRYLGAKTSNPTLDNDGNALVAGALYFNTVVPEMRLYTGSAWVAAYVSGASYVAKAGDTMTGTLNLPSNGLTVGTNQLAVSSSNVGIGTSSPSTKLTVSGPGNGNVATIIGNASLTGSAPTNTGSIRLIDNPTASTAAGGFEFLTSTFGSGYGWKIASIDSSGVQLTFSTRQNSATWSEQMRIDSSGNVGIGTTSPATKLYVSGNAAANISALTDASTIAVDMSVGNNFSVTLGGNRTLGNPTNLTAGQSGVIFITQDGTGSRTLAYSSYWDFPSQTAPTLTTTANAVDVLVYTVRSSTSIAAQLITNIG